MKNDAALIAELRLFNHFDAANRLEGATTMATTTTLKPRAENRAIRAAYNEMKAWVDGLRPSDVAETHGISEEEAKRTLEIMWALVDKVRPAGGHP